jgi:hypothetical protein
MLDTKRTTKPLETIDLRAQTRPASAEAPRDGPGLISRLFWIGVGFGVMVTGFALMLSVFVAFIGLPMFVFGLALMQSQEQR